ncbi:hypothetical protein Lepil_2856 [Leptonema illini DSM 21528]|uniref:Uncharacterized protein n=1 Tax=Leptonema illini DSM 21528 TaxID=929563 RepID=H2CD49_9LEPT|nr:hypothetical protein Lepil_2856 [Leptonema illini DSM 21528]
MARLYQSLAYRQGRCFTWLPDVGLRILKKMARMFKY